MLTKIITNQDNSNRVHHEQLAFDINSDYANLAHHVRHLFLDFIRKNTRNIPAPKLRILKFVSIGKTPSFTDFLKSLIILSRIRFQEFKLRDVFFIYDLVQFLFDETKNGFNLSDANQISDRTRSDESVLAD